MNNPVKSSVELHPAIDHALFLVDMHAHYVRIYEDIIQWNEETGTNFELFEDETQFNQNWLGLREGYDREFIEDSRKELKHHKEELENQKSLLRIYMEAFNGGWIF